MTDHRTLHDAFAEFERRADASPTTAAEPRPSAGQRRPPVLLIAASVVLVLAVAIGAVLLSGKGDNDGTPAAGPVDPAPSASASVSPSTPPSPSTSPSGNDTSTSVTSSLPSTAADLLRRLREVLGDTATVTATTPAGADTPYLVGVLTADGSSGGYDIQINQDNPGDDAICEDQGESVCTVRRLADGSSLARGVEKRGSTLYLVNLVRPDGASLLMHVSNQQDPKGAGAVLSDTPPLTIDQMVTLLRSERWGV